MQNKISIVDKTGAIFLVDFGKVTCVSGHPEEDKTEICFDNKGIVEVYSSVLEVNRQIESQIK